MLVFFLKLAVTYTLNFSWFSKVESWNFPWPSKNNHYLRFSKNNHYLRFSCTVITHRHAKNVYYSNGKQCSKKKCGKSVEGDKAITVLHCFVLCGVPACMWMEREQKLLFLLPKALMHGLFRPKYRLLFSNVMRSDPSAWNVPATTWYSRNWRVKARRRSTYSTLPLESYHPLWPLAFSSLQSKLPALNGWPMQFTRLECSKLYLERTC